MKFIADFHLHSHHSIATSKSLTPEQLDRWAMLKGIKVIGTGDFTHPGWYQELREKLIEAEPGLFKLNPEYKTQQESDTRFILTCEISTIYKKNNKVRKVHHLIFSPDFSTVERIQQSLERIGNIRADGRPILGLDSRDLLEIALSCSENIFFVPAHIWTPWFSVLGAGSGFSSIEECYDDLSEYIRAVETGLSSDPPMNWICSFLDRFTLISNSDAHSPGRLGREANIFDAELSYDAIIGAMRSSDSSRFLGTVEFFPQEGKYHYDGHRKCGIRWDPLQTLKNKSICPVCGKKVTIGVLNRVMQLADRSPVADGNQLFELSDTERGVGKGRPPYKDLSTGRSTGASGNNRAPFYSLIPLKEILSEITSTGPETKKVTTLYHDVITRAGSEFGLLLSLPLQEIKEKFSEPIFEAMRRMREGEVHIEEGFDGEYGRVRVFDSKEKEKHTGQHTLFTHILEKAREGKTKRSFNYDLADFKKLQPGNIEKKSGISSFSELNVEQQRAKEHGKGPAIVLAGPGTGKTQVLTMRVAWLILKESVNPNNILALTFTNRAANEMQRRAKELVGDGSGYEPLVCTFHRFGLSVLKRYSEILDRSENFSIIDEQQKRYILKNVGCNVKNVGTVSDTVSKLKRLLLTSQSEITSKNKMTAQREMTAQNEMTAQSERSGNIQMPDSRAVDSQLSMLTMRYESFLRENDLFDLDDLISSVCTIFARNPEIASMYRERFQWIMVDEYQDINFAQYRLIQFLAQSDDSNIFVIGDPNQAIYGFRGASVEYIERFLEDYPKAAVYRLKKSYRCSNAILKGSREVMQENQGFKLDGIKRGVKIKIIKHPTDRSEAEWVARTIEEMIGGLRFFSIDSKITDGSTGSLESTGLINPVDSKDPLSLSDFAVLARIGGQMDVLKKAFNDHSIPCQEVLEVPFFEKEPVRSIIDLLKLSTNPENTFLRSSAIEKCSINKSRLANLIDLTSRKKHVNDKLLAIIESLFSNEQERHEKDISMLLNLAGQCSSSSDLLERVSLGKGVDYYDQSREAVSLLTIHSAKGLEFTAVFIVGCEDGLLPYTLFERNPADIDEEKRLLYVGMTRAKRYLLLSHASKRYLFGRMMHPKRSPFLDGIEDALLESSKTVMRAKKSKSVQPELF
jgi:DNA helicase-2/ATP-dependent DNA helicase PcrA